MDYNKEKEFLESYEKYSDAIYRHCYFRTYDKELAEDLTQETFIKTWKYIVVGQEIKNLKAFLYKVAVNLIIDNSRKKKAVSLDELGPNVGVKEKDSIMRLIYDGFEFNKIVKLFDELPDNQRQVMVMRYVDQLLPSEIAEVLGQTANAVSVRISQATNKIRQIIKTNERR